MPASAATPISPALVVDGSSSSFFAGLLAKEGSWLAYQKASEPALESLFKTVGHVLEEGGVELEQVQSFIYCEGPGSVLGLRLCAMAIETWRHTQARPADLYAYNSLQLTAADLQKKAPPGQEALLVSDWKKGTWNSLKFSATGLGAVTPVSTTELSDWAGPLYHLPARKGWQAPPEKAAEIPYSPESLPGLREVPGLIQPRPEVTLYQSGSNVFQKWTPERHRAGSATSNRKSPAK